ncbi:MAG: DUF4332 domain-containing protein [Synechococcaceae cyanobacterium RM1_1_27]|nr:DUF4332 domain-containing protein [Synechococcaceae cyanobacterium RM1_1_27]
MQRRAGPLVAIALGQHALGQALHAGLVAPEVDDQDDIAWAKAQQVFGPALRVRRNVEDVPADLAQVPGVGCIYAGVLLHVGVCSSVQLAKASADSLHQQIMRLQVRTMSRDRKLSVGLVNQWINESSSRPPRPNAKSAVALRLVPSPVGFSSVSHQ